MAFDRERAQRLYLRVAGLEESEREAAIASECGGDDELRAAVEAMLRERTSSAPTLAAQSDAAPIREQPGSMIGPYRLQQLIGEGGFGSVFMAEQEKPVRRRVALKIIKLGMDTRQVVARF